MVGHGHENSQEEHVAVPSELVLDVVLGEHDEVVGHLAQEGHGHGEVVAVGLDEVVPRYRGGVDVMLAERPQKILQETFNFEKKNSSNLAPESCVPFR